MNLMSLRRQLHCCWLCSQWNWKCHKFHL